MTLNPFGTVANLAEEHANQTGLISYGLQHKTEATLEDMNEWHKWKSQEYVLKERNHGR